MTAIKIDVAQNTSAWQIKRLGHFTASAISALMGKGRAKDDVFSASGKTYLYKVAYGRMIDTSIFADEDATWQFLERIGGGSRATQHGHDHEINARMAYYGRTGAAIEDGCMYTSKEMPMLTASPDGLVGEDGLVEIKCPYGMENFVRYATCIKDAESLKATNADYYWQVQCQLAVTGRKWCDFVVYDPAVISQSCIHIARIERNDDDIKAMLDKVLLAEAAVNEIISNLTPKF